MPGIDKDNGKLTSTTVTGVGGGVSLLGGTESSCSHTTSVYLSIWKKKKNLELKLPVSSMEQLTLFKTSL